MQKQPRGKHRQQLKRGRLVMREVSVFFWTLLLGVALAGGSAQAENDDDAFDGGDSAYLPSPPPAPTSNDVQVKSLLMRAGVKIPLDAALDEQQGHDQLLQLLRLDPRGSIRASAGSLLIRHPMLDPTSLEMLVPLFERIPPARAEERSHLPRAWLELRAAGEALLLAAPERMAALLNASSTEDTQTIEGLRDAILGQHGDTDAQRRLRDALLQCIADEPEFVDCLVAAPVRDLGTLALVQERWDTASPEQRAALLRWVYPGDAVREFALASVSGVTDPALRSALIDVAMPLLDPDGLQRVLEESLHLVAQSGQGVESARDDRGLPLTCGDSVPLLAHLSRHSDQLVPKSQIWLADQMISAAIQSPEPLRACLLQMAVSYDPERNQLVQSEFASRRESDGNPSVEALAGLFATEGADDWLVQPVILRGTAEKWLLVTQQMPDEQWARLTDAVLTRLEDFSRVAAEYFALMPYKVRRGEAIAPPPLLKAELHGHEIALQRMQSLAPEKMPALAQQFEAQNTDAARFLALEIWSDAKEDPASRPHRQRLAEALLTAQHPNLREFGAEALAKLDAGTE